MTALGARVTKCTVLQLAHAEARAMPMGTAVGACAHRGIQITAWNMDQARDVPLSPSGKESRNTRSETRYTSVMCNPVLCSQSHRLRSSQVSTPTPYPPPAGIARLHAPRHKEKVHDVDKLHTAAAKEAAALQKEVATMAKDHRYYAVKKFKADDAAERARRLEALIGRGGGASEQGG